MKAILALALLGATVLLVGGEEFSAEHAAFFDAVEDPGDGPHPSDHPLRQCAAKAKECFNATGGDACKKVACVKAFGECLKANKPTNLPTVVPPRVEKCKALTKKCFTEEAGDDCSKQLMCLRRFKMCLHCRPHRPRPTPPGFVRKCKVLKEICLERAGDACTEKLRCLQRFVLCIHPLEFVRQCAAKLVKVKECWHNAGDAAAKLECANAFRECLKANKPNVIVMLPRAKKCFKSARNCAMAAKDCDERLKCPKDLGMCLHRKRPGRPHGNRAEEEDEFQDEHEEFVAFL